MKRPVRPSGRSVNDPPWWLEAAGWVMVVLFGLLLGALLIEFFAGCGETYVDANGVRHQYECVFIPNKGE